MELQFQVFSSSIVARIDLVKATISWVCSCLGRKLYNITIVRGNMLVTGYLEGEDWRVIKHL
jgi:hypothetical protein